MALAVAIRIDGVAGQRKLGNRGFCHAGIACKEGEAELSRYRMTVCAGRAPPNKVCARRQRLSDRNT